MNKSQVMALLKANRGKSTGRVKNLDIGLSVLRKLAKQVGRDHDLAMELWQSDVYEARVMGLLIDDPKQITREQAEAQVEQLDQQDQGILTHVFSCCDASLAKTSFVVELADDWISSKDLVRRKSGYGLLYEIAKFKGKKAPDDAFFLKHIKRIEDNYRKDGSTPGVFSLLSLGKRNPKLNAAALKVAKLIGPIEYEDKNCEPFDLVGHLSKDHLKKRLGIK
jgi:hypothetical protein